MRKKIIAGNWKMNKTFSESIELTKEVLRLKVFSDDVSVIIAPAFPFISKLSKLARQAKRPVYIAAQNCSSEESGAFTGEVSAAMLHSVGADFIIIGHSERRQYFNESHEQLKKKVDLVLKHELSPIFCCGELLEERKSGKHFDTISKQLADSLFHLPEEQIGRVIIAYEPVWAIGTGMNATAAQAQEMHEFIRKIVAERYDKKTADNISILYGGSCNEKNAEELFSCKDVDGGLIGGASLNAEIFSNQHFFISFSFQFI